MFISTHTPLAGRDEIEPSELSVLEDFNSHAPCGARREGYDLPKLNIHISTHTPLAGRDISSRRLCRYHLDFNSHAPCGARRRDTCHSQMYNHFNSHAPCGARHLGIFIIFLCSGISTHTPLAGRDNKMTNTALIALVFQLTRPLRGATLVGYKTFTDFLNFNSHAPCGARLWKYADNDTIMDISTHTPLAGRDLLLQFLRIFRPISTHTPLAGRDPIICAKGSRQHKMRKIYNPISRKIPVFTLFL